MVCVIFELVQHGDTNVSRLARCNAIMRVMAVGAVWEFSPSLEPASYEFHQTVQQKEKL